MPKVNFYGTGRRKNAVARVFLVPGEGKVTINNRDIKDYFGRKILQIQAVLPLEITGTAGRFDV
ncbi:MAG: 30S ribosomal protein S9, partial [Desulfotomaculales bacterium]